MLRPEAAPLRGRLEELRAADLQSLDKTLPGWRLSMRESPRRQNASSISGRDKATFSTSRNGVVPGFCSMIVEPSLSIET